VAGRALAAAALVAVLVLGAAPARATFPGENGQIAYTFWGADRPGVSAFELRARRPGARLGTTIVRCVYPYRVQHDPPCRELMHPAWSPDGELIAATELGPVETGERRLVILRADGSLLSRLPPLTSVEERGGGHTQTEADPAWSPEGSRLVFSGQTGFNDLGNRRSNLDVYVVNADGTGLRRLTHSRAGDTLPAWGVGRSGGRIAFTRNRAGREDIYTIRLDGTGLRRVTRGGGAEPSWSPDGSRLAFVRSGRIHVVGADGGGLRRVVGGFGSQPVWSPDGRRIAFVRNFTNPEVARIYTVGVDGRGLRMVTSTTHGMPLGPIDWQPSRSGRERRLQW
jgi:Tol biopolymer transport system component